MAVSLLGHEVSDLCLGKPPLRSLSVSAKVGDALSVLKRNGDSYLSVWSCDHFNICLEDCQCIGKVCMMDIVCFLCKQENLLNPSAALESPVSVLVPKNSGIVRHLEPHASLLEAIDMILEGAQNLVIPLHHHSSTRKKLLLQKPSFNTILHNHREYCWLTQEDIIRYLLNSISIFSPSPIQAINSLNIIDTDDILAVRYDDPALSALPLLSQSLTRQTSVAIVDDGKIIGEISPFTINACDETVAAAIATLSAGDLMAYIDCGGPPEDLIRLVKERLEDRKLGAASELMGEEYGLSWSSYSSSSDEESGSILGRSGRLGGYSARVGRRSEAIVCYPWSSLVAVMIQALAHRVSYVWVVEDDGTLAGIVTFTGMMTVFRECLYSTA
ncbi:CBS domain-containing protein [Cephalotus follicularis]|uniref:CBS domain-containing protein n=1 Tax=Cephalotus follicularis TaxID=3775 RepID=A0A1Q3C2E1_CEPFO|nr:CBS domain-containing protein [Cephalotus follicularis]